VTLARVGGVLDFLVRLAFFAAAPFVLVLVASLFPVTGALVQICLGLVAFLAGEALRRVSQKSKLVSKALSSQLAFEAHYRAHRPRPFLYYVFYPLLFPYWLAVPTPGASFSSTRVTPSSASGCSSSRRSWGTCATSRPSWAGRHSCRWRRGRSPSRPSWC
jgi:hypothetical protein